MKLEIPCKIWPETVSLCLGTMKSLAIFQISDSTVIYICCPEGIQGLLLLSEFPVSQPAGELQGGLGLLGIHFAGLCFPTVESNPPTGKWFVKGLQVLCPQGVNSSRCAGPQPQVACK